ncbi:serine hydrolase domain-containing protein [Pontibacter akesuensis]|uniref:CubicO group peptidase, beta-lactamase class C family n=1 Tax=Pontibacter akesuensis TaxID=388950 RepID=A0A1I7FIZ1_9BACT|nr:serine hydrolase domain-containing protein [Pontibacter akesuensis]SFU36140.1 CubicO group peptidase, beta-lactamase class C family [Pontibacter akesuensis]
MVITNPRNIAILLLALIFSFSARGQVAEAEADLRRIMDEMDVVGMSVAVVKDDKIIYSNALGLQDVERNAPLKEEHIFRIASISKSFSATSVMQLVEAGKLSLSDDMSDLVGFRVRNPKYPEKVITLKMALSHTSSINDSEGYFNLDVINPAKNPDWAKCYNDYEPGKGYEYCNLNFNMIGTIIEKKSGERFDQYVKQHILNPLGLYGGYWVESLDSTRFATLYAYDPATKEYTPSPSAYAPRREEIQNYVMGYSAPIFSPTGGMKMSATDLAKYMLMHMNDGAYNGVRIISKKSAKRMQKKVAENGYGLAIDNVENLIPGKTMRGHTGTAYGLYSAMFFHPKEKFGIVVLTNGSNTPAEEEPNQVIVATVNSLYNHLIKQQ